MRNHMKPNYASDWSTYGWLSLKLATHENRRKQESIARPLAWCQKKSAILAKKQP